MKIRLHLFAILALGVVLTLLVGIAQSPSSRPSTHLGRLVFTDYAKPDYNFTVDVFDLERGTRTPLQREDYRDFGSLYAIDGQHAYMSLCYAMGSGLFCSAPVNTIVAPEERQRFEKVKPFWDVNYGPPVWSPDGTHIAFSVVDKGTQTASLFTGDTHVMNADGTNIVDLTPVESINGFDFAWSPDSRQIAFACSNAQFLCISSSDGSHLQKLTMPDYTRVQHMTWSPDGHQLVFSLTAADYRNSELYLINTDGSNLHRLFEPTDFDFHDSKPQWSPDGSKILFQSGRRGTMGIYVIKPDGTDLHHLSQGNSLDFGAVWSPDSLNVAYFSWRLEEKSVILYVADASRGNPRKITDNSTFNLLDTASPELFWLP